MKTVLSIALAAIVGLMSAPSDVVAGGGNRLELNSRLTPIVAGVKAKARYRARSNERELQVEIENVRMAAGTSLSVIVNGQVVGSMALNNFGAARLNLNSTRGQTVPAIKSGDSVAIQTTSGGVLLAAGSFQ